MEREREWQQRLGEGALSDLQIKVLCGLRACEGFAVNAFVCVCVCVLCVPCLHLMCVSLMCVLVYMCIWVCESGWATARVSVGLVAGLWLLGSAYMRRMCRFTCMRALVCTCMRMCVDAWAHV